MAEPGRRTFRSSFLNSQFQDGFDPLNSIPSLGLAWDRTMAVEQTEYKTIRLTGPITLYEVSAVRESLRKALVEGKPLSLDLSDSGPWDLAGVQLLVSCMKTARDRERQARLVNVPKVCVEVAERCGLGEWLRAFQK
jgi:anti-anti-sigma regulatory factor